MPAVLAAPHDVARDGPGKGHVQDDKEKDLDEENAKEKSGSFDIWVLSQMRQELRQYMRQPRRFDEGPMVALTEWYRSKSVDRIYTWTNDKVPTSPSIRLQKII